MPEIDRNFLERRSYKKYCESEHWYQLRMKKYEQAGHHCAICLSDRNKLNVHHIRYKNLTDVTTDDLMVLCEYCHSDLHEAIRREWSDRSHGFFSGMKTVNVELEDAIKIVTEYRANKKSKKDVGRIKFEEQRLKSKNKKATQYALKVKKLCKICCRTGATIEDIETMILSLRVFVDTIKATQQSVAQSKRNETI